MTFVYTNHTWNYTVLKVDSFKKLQETKPWSYCCGNTFDFLHVAINKNGHPKHIISFIHAIGLTNKL